MSDFVSVEHALKFGGSLIVLIAGFAAWIYQQFISKHMSKLDEVAEDLRKRVRALEVGNAEREGKDFTERFSKLEALTSVLDKEVAVVKASEAARNVRLAEGLDQLQRLVEQLRGDINIGDLESRISSAQALVRTLQVAVTLAKLQSSETQERALAELRIAETTQLELLQQRAPAPANNGAKRASASRALRQADLER